MTPGTLSLEGRNFLITGGTRGIGRAITMELATAGATVVAIYVRNEADAQTMMEDALRENLRIVTCRADLTSSNGLRIVDEAIGGLEGPLHGLVHSAATGIHKPFDQLELRHYDWTFSLNVRAFFELTRRCLQRFARNASIVAISSQGAERVLPAYSIIGASKGALEALARHLAVELAPRGIRVNILSPGAVQTQAWEAMPDAERRLGDLIQKAPLGRLATPEDVANAAHFLVSDAASAVTGQTLVIDCGAGLPL